MSTDPRCPQCGCAHAYPDGSLWICPECGHEWNPQAEPADTAAAADDAVHDANGTPLANGDSVTVLKDLKVKGASSVIKGGTKVRNIRLTDGADGHNIACKIPGIGAMNLKSEFVKKA
ncbi:alkylphosphonate utilization protein [Gluconacetobacter entanii]|uniref:PhnA protein n=1 Tax=Gluconacetobacter entanii TaxID=108528 RepID=A0A318PRL0_9PROT|nr:zinc ribbon domain-containing protein YjdM [Gluconacetobacter entanii]MBE7619313.1 alkylphosphonate utilization protein [Komagataeibacter sp. FXV2]MCE2578723.1 alkylphosphonate utilization protein [Komagataeibacter sp. FNDCR1]MBY4638903.1 alkylphosphonate utilization protein [Gluconacetobacter entanii]MCW4579575.1 zinc ribbon domain-containing protein YjdM [Gluconacetobacter entanii]MCW4582981.1 zinc ribbon domain-containing protein YjdM [Gluconacetobacter entanii]